jgi:integrase
VPLHDYVYKALKDFAVTNKQDKSGYIFNPLRRGAYSRAVTELGKLVGMDTADLKKENITFYSGRHYWKTLMNAEGLGDDVEEVFMGHWVNNTVAETYNHRDTRGTDMLVKKAKKAFAILDKRLLVIKK